MDSKQKPNPKTYFLLGESGVGKSSTLNKIAKKELAKIGKGLESETLGYNLYEVSNETLGDLVIIDSQGLNDTYELNDGELMNKLLSYFLKNESINLKIDGILYFHDAIKTDRVYDEKHLRVFKELIGEDFAKSVCVIFTKYYLQSFLIQNDSEVKEKFDNIIKKFSKFAAYVYWDNKASLPNQEIQLKEALDKLKPPTFKMLEELKLKIKEKANELREKDKVQLMREVDCKEKKICLQKVMKTDTKRQNENLYRTFVEYISTFGMNIFAWGSTKDCTGSIVISPDYPDHTNNKKVEKVGFQVTHAYNIVSHKVTIHGEGSPLATVVVEYKFTGACFGQANLTLKIDYTYSYEVQEVKEEYQEMMVDGKKTELYEDYKHPSDYYIPQAQQLVLSQALNQRREIKEK